jgi:hypothetical protein
MPQFLNTINFKLKLDFKSKYLQKLKRNKIIKFVNCALKID